MSGRRLSPAGAHPGGIQGANTGERDASEQALRKGRSRFDAAFAIRPQTTTAVEQLNIAD